jgi:hypothetical protein
MPMHFIFAVALPAHTLVLGVIVPAKTSRDFCADQGIQPIELSDIAPCYLFE